MTEIEISNAETECECCQGEHEDAAPQRWLDKGDLVKVQVRLAPGAPFASEGMWAEVERVREGRLTATLRNTSFYVALSVGDVVRAEVNADGLWQVTHVLKRGDAVSYHVYLTTEEELDNDITIDEMVQRERAVLLSEQLIAAGFEFEMGGAIGMAPLVAISTKATTQEQVDAFEEALQAVSDANSCTPVWLSGPDSDLDVEEVDFALLAEPTTPPVVTDYRAAQDPFWDTFRDEDTPDSEHLAFLKWVDDVASGDQRVATDLEGGRYDRVVTLLERLLTPAEDLAPLDGPIWGDDR